MGADNGRIVSQKTPINIMQLFFIFIFLTTVCLSQQKQAADNVFQPKANIPTFAPGEEPVVAIDEAHHNFHTVDGRYKAFAEVLRLDGCTVIPSPTPFNRDSLDKIDILVISNALNKNNFGGRWTRPIYPAFTETEVATVRDWVNDGGTLLLIADHMPFPGAAKELAAEFGVAFNDGFAWQPDRRGQITFRRSDGTLADHPITNGRNAAEKIDSVTSFTGQAFQIGKNAKSLMTFGKEYISEMPESAWQFSEGTPSVSIEGWSQGAVLEYSKGRVAIFGEAAMFTAQISRSGTAMGMNAPNAKQNQQFLLNVVHWLMKKIDSK